jgi:hypothetical protein
MMTGLALGFAVAVVFAAGIGIALLVCGGKACGVAETISSAWFFGTGAISISLWVCGWVVTGVALQLAVTTIALVLFVSGMRRTKLRFVWPQLTRLEFCLVALVAIELLIVTTTSFRHTLGWDGVLNWEVKARYAFENGGVLPRTYFATAGREFTHAGYPLAIPFTELWVYLALGAAHQFWAKTIFALYLISGTILLAATIARLTSRRWLGLAAAAVLLFVPQLATGIGGAISGYADLPLSFVYCSAVAYAAIAGSQRDDGALHLFAGFLALLPWFKQEGIVLWFVAAVTGAICCSRMISRRRLLLFLPGLMLFAAWHIFLRMMNAHANSEYALPPLAEIPGRLQTVADAVFVQIGNMEQWSILWFVVALAACQLLIMKRTRATIATLLSAIAPTAFYCAAYLFSTWSSLPQHIGTSLPRLLMQTVPVSVLVIALAVAESLRAQRTFPRAVTGQCATTLLPETTTS